MERRSTTSRADRTIFDGGCFGGSAKLGEDCRLGNNGDCCGESVESVAVDFETHGKRSEMTSSDVGRLPGFPEQRQFCLAIFECLSDGVMV